MTITLNFLALYYFENSSSPGDLFDKAEENEP